MKYCVDIFNYNRRVASEVAVGVVPMGGNYPIRVQSMTNTSTMDTEASVRQCEEIIVAGGEYVRLTTQGIREAQNLRFIHDQLRAKGLQTPLAADVHFNPKVADEAAQIVEKVRINPGNYVDSVKTFQQFEYTDAEYAQELTRIEDKLLPLIAICKKHKTAIRIGVNHGSLSDRIMSRYGDTPRGMVEACMEFLQICVRENFMQVVISVKASNTMVMVHTVRLLVSTMDEEKMHFPLHLGVTEAGDAEDGRIKSAVGIGALLADGIGDTIRVSLSEHPAMEIPVAKKMVEYIASKTQAPVITEQSNKDFFNPFIYTRRKTVAVGSIGASFVPIVIQNASMSADIVPLKEALQADFVYYGTKKPLAESLASTIIDASCWQVGSNAYPLFKVGELGSIQHCASKILFLQLTLAELTDEVCAFLSQQAYIVLIIDLQHQNAIGEGRAIFAKLADKHLVNPVVLSRSFNDTDAETLQIKSSIDVGSFFLDGLGDGIMLSNTHEKSLLNMVSLSFSILQATRARMSKTEFISCPGCGRTLFDLQHTIANIKAETSHLKQLKIGIMGCIVNGPGEMADADYGYVGAGKGKVSLYKRQECVQKNIPEKEAVQTLIQLIKDNGDWHEK
ncbi:MAG: 4-hydroxy-3-methylbut-2-en-1-yl diphosphate synthase [Paludibacteraceae bacterium]|nr:4-hydroxy-3-methylbut-2-en-1-yl diphosphate synthase [Paludibacteraceae bacterium]MBP6284043.1 4-hydroxy-3-methylbut-2-en-1-yl diphosphate synthase [Paludibacteraceae bacterium]